MTQIAQCPGCRRKFRIPDSAAVGRKGNCATCKTGFRIQRNPAGELVLELAVRPSAAARVVVHRERREKRARDSAAAQVVADTSNKVRARIVIALCALVLLVAGIFAEDLASRGVEKSRAAAAILPPTQTLVLRDGTRMSAQDVVVGFEGALRVERTINFVLSAVFFLLFYWSFRAPAHAMLVALALFTLNIVANAILEPSTITNGIWLKLLIITSLAAGYFAARRPDGNGQHRDSPRAKRRRRPRARSA